MANAGLSIKERMALLQNNNNNNNNNNASNNNTTTTTTTTTTKPAGGPIKPTPGVTPKPKPPPSEAKPPGIAGLKPVTPSKPAVAGHRPEPSSNKPGTPDKPATANKPVTASKPALAGKPGTALKPSTFSSPRADEGGKSNGADSPLFPKLRPVGTSPGKVIPPLPNSPSRELGGGGEKPASRPAAQPVSSQEVGGSDSSSSEMPEKPTRIVSPLKTVSVQERLAALRRKSSEAETMDPKLKPHHNSVSPTPKPPSSTKPSPVFPADVSPGVVNGQQSDAGTAAPKAEVPGFKRSDIAKSLTQAADRILRNKAAPSAAAAAAGDAGSKEARKTCSHLFQRRCDGKKFRQVEVTSVISSQPAPAKPSRIDGVDLQPFLRTYATAKQQKLEVDAGKSSAPTEAEGEEEDAEELYVEAESTSVTIQGRKGSVKRATSNRVSLIPEFTEEEEQFDLHTDGTSGARVPPPSSEPEDNYDDCESTLQTPRRPPPPPPQVEEEEPDEIYEPLDEELPDERGSETTTEPEPSPPPLPSPNKIRDKDKENREKEEEAKKKDSRAKEEANKKEEKERKKKEEDMKKLRRKFGLSESDEKVGDGVVKSNASGGVFSKDLAVVRGETIAILRMDGNPVGKWLAQNEQGKIGFVSSNNIEISTPTIRHLMAGVKHEPAANEEPEELYEALPDDMDEIYEEV